MNQAGADPSQSLQAELLKRWGESAKTRRELEVARTNFKYLEAQFADNASQWEAWRKDPAAYKTWMQSKISNRPDRSHGFRYRGQYEEQVPEMLKIAEQG